ncbi:hypothetical protein GCM10015535_68580 [Streptomyces gelaticus]|uniref:Uncharacterized protein n=1 Tax=Streptomyces gelaticus TaxID=285446 RepID=A0ABQ2WBQ6_9ACTN|nr:hypothetical protein GCM10015535_68580 [Streptomyces gelaticus]
MPDEHLETGPVVHGSVRPPEQEKARTALAALLRWHAVKSASRPGRTTADDTRFPVIIAVIEPTRPVRREVPDAPWCAVARAAMLSADSGVRPDRAAQPKESQEDLWALAQSAGQPHRAGGRREGTGRSRARSYCLRRSPP